MGTPDNPLLAEFGVEADQHIEAIEPILLRSEWAAPPPEDINLLFRSFHSIKGLARVVSLKGLEALAHESENLLSPVRAGQLGFDREIQEVLLAALDGVKEGRALAASGADFVPSPQLLQTLARVAKRAETFGSASKVAVVEAATSAWHDLDSDHGTLEAMSELLQELLPGIAADLAEQGGDRGATVDDLEVLAHGLSRIQLHGLMAAAQHLAEATQAPSATASKRGESKIGLSARRHQAIALAHLIRLAARFSRLVDCDCGTDEAIKAGGALLRFGLLFEIDAMKAALTKDADSMNSLSESARDIVDIAAVLLPGSPLAALIGEMTCPLPEVVSRPGSHEELLGQALDLLRNEVDSSTSPASDVTLLGIDQLRLSFGEPYRLSESSLKLLRDRKVDGDRFRSTAPWVRARIEQITERKGRGEDFFEILVERPGSHSALWSVALQLTDLLAPLQTLTTSVDGLPFLALLIVSSEREDKIRERISAIISSGSVLVRKLDGRVSDAVFGPRARSAAQAGGSADHQVRVPVEVLDRLFGRVGEFFGVSSRLNALVFDSEVPDVLRQLSDVAVTRSPELLPAIDRIVRQQRELSVIEADIHRLISLIHESTLGLRVIPLEVLFGRFPRMVRDTARGGSKSVRFEARPDGIKVDKGMVEGLSDPLMHLLRNAVDHGIETPEERQAEGKSPAALLRLTGEQRGNHIVIEVSDDGRGINIERVRQKAVGMGLVGEAESHRLSDEQIARFIFAPGFSTASQITSTSGRGVGMDVVLVNVTTLGGKVDISTRAGVGTTFRLELPLSAAIQTVLLAQTSVQLVAFPERMVSEALAFRREDVQIVNGQRSILLHGRYLPIFSLVDLLKLPSEGEGAGSEMAIIVCEWGGRRIGVEVFKILRRHEMLIREMPPRIASIPGIGGISTLGTDRIVIVVSPDAVFDLARRAAVFGLRTAPSRLSLN